MKKGFTLVELIIVIVIFAIVSGIGVNIIYNVFYGYSDTKVKTLLYNEINFTIERMDKELHNAVPNSIRTENNLLQYLLFSKSFFYERAGSNAINVYDNLSNLNLEGKKIAIYILSYSDIFTSNYNSQKLYTIRSITKNSNSWTLTFDKAILEDSPYNRCYLVDTPVTIYQYEDKLTRCFGYEIDNSNGEDSGTCNIMTNFVDNVSFQYFPGTIKRDGILKIALTLKKNDVTLKYKHEVHFRNVP